MPNLKLRILSLLGLRCKFAYKCPLYKSNAVTCKHPTAENGYCGKYRQFLRERNGASA